MLQVKLTAYHETGFEVDIETSTDTSETLATLVKSLTASGFSFERPATIKDPNSISMYVDSYLVGTTMDGSSKVVHLYGRGEWKITSVYDNNFHLLWFKPKFDRIVPGAAPNLEAARKQNLLIKCPPAMVELRPTGRKTDDGKIIRGLAKATVLETGTAIMDTQPVNATEAPVNMSSDHLLAVIVDTINQVGTGDPGAMHQIYSRIQARKSELSDADYERAIQHWNAKQHELQLEATPW